MYLQQQRLNQQYRQTQVMSADPLQLIIMTYDLAIAGCKERNLMKVTTALAALRDSLNHEQGGQIASNLLGLYMYLADEARQGRFDETAQLLTELRETWAHAREQMLVEAQAMPALNMAA